jgi:hypothetical protein
VKAWKAALAASIATAVIALIVVAPMAVSSKSRPGLKVVSVAAGGGASSPDTVTAKCPRGFVAIAGGFNGQEVNVLQSEKRDERRWTVRAEPSLSKRGQLLEAKAVCAKGIHGFHVTDAGLR